MNRENKRRVVVIGGGITGLTAAYYLQQEAKKQSLPIEVLLMEAGPRLGGKIQTIFRDGFIIEKGPDSFYDYKLSATKLANELGMEKEIIHNESGQLFVLVRNQLFPVPRKFKMVPFMTTSLFSPIGKLRAAADVILPKSKEHEDQAVGAFFRRRLGDEVVENLIEPLLSGIYAGDIDELSLMSTLPYFYQIEQKYGSLLRGMKKSEVFTFKRKQNNQSEDAGQFFTLKNGLQSLVERLEASLTQATILKSMKVTQVVKENQRYILSLNDFSHISADAIVVAVPHTAACSIFSDYPCFNPLKDLSSTSIATVTMAFDESAVEQDIEGIGFRITRNSDSSLTACTWTHKRWPHTAPLGKVLLRCYVGRSNHETIVDLSDDEITNIVLEDINKMIHFKSKPSFTIVSRWKKAIPQYTVGHRKRVETVKSEIEKNLPGVILCGSSYDGISMPECIEQGGAAVQQVLQLFANKPYITR